jgi:hypothetical protein
MNTIGKYRPSRLMRSSRARPLIPGELYVEDDAVRFAVLCQMRLRRCEHADFVPIRAQQAADSTTNVVVVVHEHENEPG